MVVAAMSGLKRAIAGSGARTWIAARGCGSRPYMEYNRRRAAQQLLRNRSHGQSHSRQKRSVAPVICWFGVS